MKKLFAIAILLTNAVAAYSQCDLKLSGHVDDSDSHEKLISASVRIVELNRRAITDEQGDFIFEGLCVGNYTLEVSHIGCETILQKVQLKRSRHLDIHLPHLKNLLEEVTVSGTLGTPNTGYKQALKGRDLQETRGQSLSEALSRINGVTLLQTGSTISKPVIHGLHSNRILTINNGVRHEGQQWGNEHAPEIDPFIADELTIIKGVEALRYGSDGIGGVILIDPKPLRYKGGLSGEFISGIFSNNRQYYVSGSLEQQFSKIPAFSYRIQGTFKKGATIRTQDYRLNNTGTQEQNYSITAGWRKEKYTLEAFYSRVNMTTGIFSGSHIGNLTDLLQAIENVRPDPVYLGEKTYSIGRPRQEADHQLLKLRGTLYQGAGKLQLILAVQQNDRKEYDFMRSVGVDYPQQELNLLSYSQDLVWEHPTFKNLKGTIGLALVQKEHRAGGRYFIPNYSSASYGIYGYEQWTKNKWSIQGGARFDHRGINTRRLRFNGGDINHDFNFSTLAASGNIIHSFNPHFKVNAMVSLASRAPDINELLSDGIHHGTATYEQGDISLLPEKAMNTGIGLNYTSDNKKLSADLTLYNNHIRDFIYRRPVPDEPVLTVAGAFPRIRFEQTDARLQGTDISVQYKLIQSMTLGSSVSLLRARNKSTNDWLILMPSDRFTQSVSVDLPNSTSLVNNYFSVEFVSVLKQERVPTKGGEVFDYKAPPSGYNLVNLQASTTTKISHLPVIISMGITNLFNVSYRDYLNSFRYFTDDMGRNINLRVRVMFGNNIKNK